MRVAYLVNRYPAASHSFIRREIEAVEAHGTEVMRVSIRSAAEQDLPDHRDRIELEKTTAILALNPIRLGYYVILAILSTPLRSLRGLKVAFRRCSWRPIDLIRRTAYFVEAAALARLVQSAGVRHIHAHFGTNSATVARIAALFGRASFSFTVHGPDEFDDPIALDLAGKVADSSFCVAISSYGRSQLLRWCPLKDWRKIRVIKCGVDESFLAEDSKDRQDYEFDFCTVARLSPQKGIPLLIDAATRLKAIGEDFRLAIVGDGELKPEIEMLVQERGLTSEVALMGLASSDEVKRSLRQARVMVLPSFAEGLPVVIMEALALRVPVIVSAIAGTPELVDEECGWLISAGSTEDLLAAMAQSLKAPGSQISRMGSIGRNRVEQSHNALENGGALNELFLTGATNV